MHSEAELYGRYAAIEKGIKVLNDEISDLQGYIDGAQEERERLVGLLNSVEEQLDSCKTDERSKGEREQS